MRKIEQRYCSGTTLLFSLPRDILKLLYVLKNVGEYNFGNMYSLIGELLHSCSPLICSLNSLYTGDQQEDPELPGNAETISMDRSGSTQRVVCSAISRWQHQFILPIDMEILLVLLQPTALTNFFQILWIFVPI